MKEVVVVSGSRTAVGNFGGGLKSVPVVELGSIVMRDVFKRVGLRPVKSDQMEAWAPDKLKGRGLIELEDAETGDIVLVDTSSNTFQNRFSESVDKEKEERRMFFKALGIDLLEVNTSEPFERSLVAFFKARHKRR